VQLLEVLEPAGRQEVFPALDLTLRLVGLITLEDLMALAAESTSTGVCDRHHHEYVRMRAAGRADAASSGIRPIDPDVQA
jgi:hypothetical protein